MCLPTNALSQHLPSYLCCSGQVLWFKLSSGRSYIQQHKFNSSGLYTTLHLQCMALKHRHNSGSKVLQNRSSELYPCCGWWPLLGYCVKSPGRSGEALLGPLIPTSMGDRWTCVIRCLTCASLSWGLSPFLPSPVPAFLIFLCPLLCLLFSSYSSVIGSQFTKRAFPFSLPKVLFLERLMACFGRGRYRLGVRVIHTWAQLLLAIVINCGDQRYPFLKCLE